jgi:putative ABC transport system permease protein
MFKNYMKITLRNIRKYKEYSFINLLGLAIGMTACFLIFLWVQDELSYDRYHENAGRIYRVVDEVLVDGFGEKSASMAFPVGETLPGEYPEIESSVRFFNFKSPSLLVEYGSTGEKRFNEPRFFFADAEVFKVFSFKMKEGDPLHALTQPNTIVISEETAQKYFGMETPLGKTLRFENRIDLLVTGVVENVPNNSHFQFDFLASFSSLRELVSENMRQSWYWNPCWTYILLKEGTLPSSLETKLHDFSQKYFPPSFKDDQIIKLQPLTKIHLHSHLDLEIAPNSDISYV